MNYPTLWCIENAKQRLLVATLSNTKEEAFDLLFMSMPRPFQMEHWKNRRSSMRAFKKLGYIAIRVIIQPKKP